MSGFKPTAEQRRVLAHSSTEHGRVLAGPGTGKSATLIALLAELAKADPAPKVRLLTFTRAATAELGQKVLDQLEGLTAEPSTVHSFAISVLLRNPGSADFPEPLRLADDWEMAEIVKPTLARRAQLGRRQLDRCIKEMAANWESLEPHLDPGVLEEERARFLGAWNEHRRIYGYTMLSELPYALRSALNDHPDLEGVDFDLLIVDEYQDLNACDLDVLRLISERGCSIIGVGDDDQSIYSFRRAAPEGIRRFPDDYPDCQDYPLSVSHRCGRRILDWATFVIEGDPDRIGTKPRLQTAEGAEAGEVGLLSFKGDASEAKGIARLTKSLIDREGLHPSDVLVLVRSDHNGNFSKQIRRALDKAAIPYGDPSIVSEMLGQEDNRRLLASLRLLTNRHDSLAWASLLVLTKGIGATFLDYVYDRARDENVQFGEALLRAHALDFPSAPRSAGQVKGLINEVLPWIEENKPPSKAPEGGWSNWVLERISDSIAQEPTDWLLELLPRIDEFVKPAEGLGRYLNQIMPIARDLALAESDGLRIMSMGMSKGLTVRATIVAGVEEDIIPHPRGIFAEERRLLYVAMTRSRDVLFCTWARRRRGPTARMGAGDAGGRRTMTTFLKGGPVDAQDGEAFLRSRWP